MDADLQPIHDRVMEATRLEHIFDEFAMVLPPRLLEAHFAPEMKEMRVTLNADAYSAYEDKEAARLAGTRLEELYADGLARSALGLFAPDGFTVLTPRPGSKEIVVGNTTYFVGEKFHVGDHTTLYKGQVKIGNGYGMVAIRLANTPADNYLLYNEIRLLDILHRSDLGYWRNLPFMLDRFSAGERVGIICRYFEGLTLTALRDDKLHRNGLDQRHVVWIMDRMLSLIGYAHKVGVIHGSITPDRVRIRPNNHNALLTGWTHAVYKPAISGERIPPVGGVFEAPEVRDGKGVGPWTDIYSLGKTLIWLIGGDALTNEMPEDVEPKLRRFLLNMVRKNPKARPRDAWQLYESQIRLKDSLWPRKFIHLNVSQRSYMA